MKNILVTGATGNVGFAAIRVLSLIAPESHIYAGVRNIQKSKQRFEEFSNVECIHFDFKEPSTFSEALRKVDLVLLIRPPQIAKVQQYFAPFIHQISAHQIEGVVFLSVQGAERSRFIPHQRIEQLITEYGLNYIFLRASYFMQNLTTTLLSDIQQRKKIILPAGKARFNWVNAENVGELAALLLQEFQSYKNNAYEVTGYEYKNFYEVVEDISSVCDKRVTYQNLNVFSFYKLRRKEGMERSKVLVMIMIHLLPRMQKYSRKSVFYENVTGKKPTRLKEFIQLNHSLLFPR